ncbi:hypothetical protein BDN72DRAFT_186947 [Pluteus cervinus]|uniref:Uncharacterized protein n=1 Tax=Pluteus cervinus TaxID=181527 RepID=A0ACD3B6K2_9AGAR|nr:hypothetical protein BDN72DRAFT_186947 [Pluteus cervinus]
MVLSSTGNGRRGHRGELSRTPMAETSRSRAQPPVPTQMKSPDALKINEQDFRYSDLRPALGNYEFSAWPNNVYEPTHRDHCEALSSSRSPRTQEKPEDPVQGRKKSLGDGMGKGYAQKFKPRFAYLVVCSRSTCIRPMAIPTFIADTPVKEPSFSVLAPFVVFRHARGCRDAWFCNKLFFQRICAVNRNGF